MKSLGLLACLLLVGCGKSIVSTQTTEDSCQIVYRGVKTFVVCKESEVEVKNSAGYVQVCPNVEGTHIETLLLVDGAFMAFLASPNYSQERLVVLEQGTLYRTTDGRNIHFKIHGEDLLYTDARCN